MNGDIMLFVCLEIFFARIIDVSISTFRMMIMVRKKSIFTPILAFCEVFVWFIAARKALKECHITLEDQTLSKLKKGYQENLTQLSIENMTKYFNQIYKKNVDNSIIKHWLKHLGNMSEVDEKLISTLSYLQKKYELVILTNWFYISQYNRLKKAKIANFFKEIISGETAMKPNFKAFKKAMGDHLPEECLMVGDNYLIDILPAKKLGMSVYLITEKEEKDIPTIKNVYELKSIL